MSASPTMPMALSDSSTIGALMEARALPQAEPLVRQFRDDLRAWRLVAQEQLRLWAKDPAFAASQANAIRDRLVVRMSGLEAKIAETIRSVKEGQVGEAELENFYRILGAFKGLSESGIEYSLAAQGIDWGQLEEARF